MANYMLEMKNITKLFPGVRALDNVNFNVKKGEVHALVGENGAGKSTLMKVLGGVHTHGTYEGHIIFNGEECKFNNIKDSENKGIGIIHQELMLVPQMTIGENIFLGNERGKRSNINWDETHSEARKLLDMVGLKEDTHLPVGELGVGKQQLIEIAKAIGKHTQLLILDEPTAALNEKESKMLLDLILKFKEEGITSIIISHKLNEIAYVADSITILRDGATIETLENADKKIDESRIIKGMVGREMTDRFPKREKNIGGIAFEVKNWTVGHPSITGKYLCKDINFNVRKGEIVGISGLMGAGRTELAQSIFGRSFGVFKSGKLYMNGKEIELKNIKQAIDNKLAYVTEDRKGDGLVLMETIRENTTMAKMEKISSKYKVIDKHKQRSVAEDYVKKLNTKTPSIEQQVENLSGGNQQKVLLSKWMFADPEVLILDEPTRGIDVGAKYEIYCIMNQLVAEGKSVIMISSELPEILGMCDRIYIMNEGKFVGEECGDDATQETIMCKILQTSEQ